MEVAAASLAPANARLARVEMEPSGGLEPQPWPVQSRPQRLARGCQVVLDVGIEPTFTDFQSVVLPLN